VRVVAQVQTVLEEPVSYGYLSFGLPPGTSTGGVAATLGPWVGGKGG
jgi:hypothetical protein